MTQNEFDLRLMDDAGTIPPQDFIVAAANPWRSAMERIMWGMALNTFQFEFWYLQYILPLLGSVLMYLGYRSLRKENLWFRLCFAITAFTLAWHAVWDVLAASPLPQAIDASPLFWPLSIALSLLSLARLIFLRAGIRRSFAAAGESKPKDWLGRGLLAHLGSYVIAIWSTLVPLTEPGAFFGPQIIDEWQWLYYGRSFAFIALEIYLLVCISKQTNALAGRGYEIAPAPVRLTARTVLIAIFAAVLLAIPPVTYLSSHVPMPEARVLEQELSESQAATKQQLIALGLPQGLADILDESELDACAGAVAVREPLVISTYLKGDLDDPDHDNFAVTPFAGLETCVSAWMVVLPDQTARVYHWFEYTQMPDARFQDQVSLEPSGNYPQSDFSARLVWTENGVPYACAPEVYLAGGTTREELEAANWAGVLFKEETERELDRLGGRLQWQPWIDFTIPRQADSMQGYIACTSNILRHFEHEAEFGPNFYDFFYFSIRHQTGFLQYPFRDLSDLGGATGSYMNTPGVSMYGSSNFSFDLPQTFLP